jgi:hypothetical protein
MGYTCPKAILFPAFKMDIQMVANKLKKEGSPATLAEGGRLR